VIRYLLVQVVYVYYFPRDILATDHDEMVSASVNPFAAAS